jgi:hypothetical protein
MFYTIVLLHASSGKKAMAGLVNEPVEVELRDGHVPTAFTWRGKRHRILEVVGWWRQPSAWWEGKKVRLFVRVRAFHRRERIVELCKAGDRWVLRTVLV